MIAYAAYCLRRVYTAGVFLVPIHEEGIIKKNHLDGISKKYLQIPAFFENIIVQPAGSLMPSGSSTLKRI